MSTTKTQHYPLGGSVARRIMNCPGYVYFVKDQHLPDIPSEYAAQGTVAHTLAAALLKDSTGDLLAFGGVGDTIKQDSFDITIDDDMFDAVMAYVTFVEKNMQAYNLHRSQMQIEELQLMPGLVFEGEQQGGTPDCVITIPYTRMIVIDYKHGAGVKVDVWDNEQLLYYATAAFYGLPEDLRNEIPQIEIVIIQPRAVGGGIQSQIIEPDALKAFHKRLIAAAKLIKPGAPLVAGDWCKFCPAAGVCPALRDKVNEEAGANFTDISLPAVYETGGLLQPEMLTPEQVARVLDHAELIRDWLEAVHKRGTYLAETGTDVPGYSLIPRRSNRKYADKQAVVDALIDNINDYEAYLKPQEPLPLTQLEKLLKKDGVTSIDLNDFIIKPDNGMTLARDDNPRPKRIASEIVDITAI